MNFQTISLRFALFALLCFVLAGCGPSFPYYTLEGSPESRVVLIHFKGGKTEKIPAGSGMGAGLTADQKSRLMNGENVTLEKGKAQVTMMAKGPMFIVKKVMYDGKEVLFHEPIL